MEKIPMENWESWKKTKFQGLVEKYCGENDAWEGAWSSAMIFHHYLENQLSVERFVEKINGETSQRKYITFVANLPPVNHRKIF